MMTYQNTEIQNVTGQILEYECNRGFVFTDSLVEVTTPIPTTTTTPAPTTVAGTATVYGFTVTQRRWKSECRAGSEVTGLTGETLQSCCVRCLGLYSQTDWVSIKTDGKKCECIAKNANGCRFQSETFYKSDYNVSSFCFIHPVTLLIL